MVTRVFVHLILRLVWELVTVKGVSGLVSMICV